MSFNYLPHISHRVHLSVGKVSLHLEIPQHNCFIYLDIGPTLENKHIVEVPAQSRGAALRKYNRIK